MLSHQNDKGSIGDNRCPAACVAAVVDLLPVMRLLMEGDEVSMNCTCTCWLTHTHPQ